MTRSVPSDRRTWHLRMPMMIGVLSALFLGSALGIWGTQTRISGAVLGKGSVQASEVSTAVQHPIGGVVAQILARDGDHVQAGDVVLRLDDRPLRSDLAIVEGQLFEALANQARLEAIIDHTPALTPHPLLRKAAADRPEVAALLDRARRELEVHYEILDNQDRLLSRQIDQVREQIAGIEAQLDAKSEHQALLTSELEKSGELADKGLVKRSVMFNQYKDAIATKGEIGRLRAQVAELNGRIAELELKRQSLAPDLKTKASDLLSKLRPERTKFLETRAALLNDLSQLEIRAPVSGVIHESRVEGLRSVVVKAQTLMSIVPSDIPVVIEIRIMATDIDQVFVGQEASVRFNAFNRRSTPMIFGDVSQVSADVLIDPVTRKPYYEVAVTLRDAEMEKLEGKKLIPGMPVEAFISTSPRTPLDYVLKPLKDYFDRAFRDA